jgi:hypothetical protein
MSETTGAVKPNFASAWKKQTMVVEFPSGNRAEVARPDAMSFLAESGDIPDDFLTILMASSREESDAATSALTPNRKLEYAKFMVAASERLISTYFVNPVVVSGNAPNYENGEISHEDVKAMDSQDKQFFLNFGMYGGEPVEALKRFRQQQAQLLAAPQNSKSIRSNAT